MCCFVVSVNIPGSDRVRIREIVIFKFICNILTAACNVVDQGAYDRQIQNELVSFAFFPGTILQESRDSGLTRIRRSNNSGEFPHAITAREAAAPVATMSVR